MPTKDELTRSGLTAPSGPQPIDPNSPPGTPVWVRGFIKRIIPKYREAQVVVAHADGPGSIMALLTEITPALMAAKPSTGALSSSPHEQNTPSTPPDTPEAIGDEVVEPEAAADEMIKRVLAKHRAELRAAFSALHQAGKLPATGGER